MKPYDRIMALIRHPDYLKDWEELLNLRKTDDKKADAWAETISKKWEVRCPPPRPVPPYVDQDNNSFKNSVDAYFDNDSPVQIMKDVPESITKKYDPLKLRTEYPNFTKIIEKACTDEGEISQPDEADLQAVRGAFGRPQTSYQGGRHIFLAIDITGKATDIVREIKGIIGYCSGLIPKDNKREKKTKIDPWKVYDMHHHWGLNFSQITQKLSGIRGNPSYNENLKAYYDAVDRAYKKAQKMIKQVKPKT